MKKFSTQKSVINIFIRVSGGGEHVYNLRDNGFLNYIAVTYFEVAKFYCLKASAKGSHLGTDTDIKERS